MRLLKNEYDKSLNENHELLLEVTRLKLALVEE